MLWELAHRTREDTASTVFRVDAPTSAAAIAALRASMPEDHVILYVRDAS